MRTTLIAASLLMTVLVGAAPGAAAFQCSSLSDTLDKACTAAAKVDLPPVGPVPTLPDADNDQIPDLLEQVICGPEATFTVLSTTPEVWCENRSDLVTPDLPDVGPTLDAVTGLINQIREQAEEEADKALQFVIDTLEDVILGVDGDQDNVPDASEFLFCLVENPNLPQDGSCTDGDYSPPA